MIEQEERKFREIPFHVSDVRVDVVEGELLLYHPQQTMAVYLNGPGAVIWGLCDGQRKVSEIVALIEQSYPVSRSDVIQDVLSTIDQLYDKNLLIRRSVN